MIWVETLAIYSNVLHPENTLEQSAANMSSVNLGFKQNKHGFAGMEGSMSNRQ
jgi:hypothetical protein